MANLTREQRAAKEAEAVARGNDNEDDGDERLVRQSSDDVRGDRGFQQDAARMDPMSESDYEKLIREEFESSILPTPPVLPGWHLCWLSATAQGDSIQRRQKVGYEPVRQSEMHGFDPSGGQKIERYEGCITCNEMVLFKLAEPKYQALMAYFHHKKPAEQEEGILRAVGDGTSAASAGEKDGMKEMEHRVEAARRMNPHFH